MQIAGGSDRLAAMTTPRGLRRALAAAAIGVLSLLLLAPPASAAGAQGTDPAGDVPFAKGDLISWRVIHGASAIDLRVRTRQGGHPVNNWPNTVTRIRWRIDTAPAAGPEYYADIVIATGVDTVILGKVRRVSDNAVIPHCTAQEHVDGDSLVETSGNLYRFRFLRGCVDEPNALRARATFIWDNGAANVGPVHTDFAPNNGPVGPLPSF
jgi:hypothetical protein